MGLRLRLHRPEKLQVSTAMQGTVTRFSQTKNGKATVYIDDKMYFVGRCDVSGLNVGDLISFEGHAFSEDGKLWGLDKWAKLPKPNGAAPRPTTPSGSLDEPMRQTCSNILASLAKAGTLKSPDELDVWVAAIKAAFGDKQQGDFE